MKQEKNENINLILMSGNNIVLFYLMVFHCFFFIIYYILGSFKFEYCISNIFLYVWFKVDPLFKRLPPIPS